MSSEGKLGVPSSEGTSSTDDEELLPFEEFSFYDFPDIPEQRWLVEDLVPAEAYGMIMGLPGAAKTFTILDMLLCIACGLPFHGKTVEKGKVLYMYGEGGTGILRRIAAWIEAHPEADPEDIKNNFRMVRKVPKANNRTQMRMLMLNAKSCKVVVLDTYARHIRGLHENNADEMGLVNEGLQEVRDECGATIIVLHHLGKDGGAERGSTSMRGDMDFMLAVRRGDAGEVIVGISKMKDDEDTLTMSFDLKTAVSVKSAYLVRRHGQSRPANISMDAKMGVRKPPQPYNPGF
jgi:RecA-family ATPase